MRVRVCVLCGRNRSACVCVIEIASIIDYKGCTGHTRGSIAIDAYDAR
jgi:hypothetical protein